MSSKKSHSGSRSSSDSISESDASRKSSSDSDSSIDNHLVCADKINIEQFRPQRPNKRRIVSSSDSGSEPDLAAGSSNNPNGANDEHSPDDPKGNVQLFSEFFKYQKEVDQLKSVAEKHTNRTADVSLNTAETVENMLSIGEKKSSHNKPTTSKYFRKSDNDSNDEWQEVSQKEERPPIKDVEIVIDLPNNIRKKKGVDLMASLKRKMNKNRKDTQILMHKVHLLCYLAFGMNLNSILNNDLILASVLSLLPSKNVYPVNKVCLDYLGQMVKWYSKNIKLDAIDNDLNLDTLQDILLAEIVDRKTQSSYRCIFIFISLLRAIGIRCRLVISFQCIPLKPSASQLFSLSNKPKTDPNKSKKKKKIDQLDGNITDESYESSENENDTVSKSPKQTESQKTVKSKYFTRSRKQSNTVDVRQDIVDIVSKRIAQEKNTKKVVKKKTKLEPKSTKTKVENGVQREITSKKLVRKKVVNHDDNRIISTDDEDENVVVQKKGSDYWVEVFLEEEEKWISVDVIHGKIHCIQDIVKIASHPISYVITWDNNCRIKDVTKRYCENWNTVTRTRRVDPIWWRDTLLPYIGKQTIHDRIEDEDLHKQQLDQPLPKSISEYKNHPLYVLKRHLLKFQAIYPEKALVFGYVRNEAVYPRECVHTLHSRDIWLKKAKTVRLNEKPFKIVKSRPKYDRLSGTYLSDLPLELFGYWQVEDYKPPKVENGVIPRNAYGNVDLFMECMIPEGAVHLRLNGLNKVAKKLQIDCAPAVVGFDFHSGASHPTFDGFIVAKEFEDTLRSAWVVDRIETEKRYKEKREARIFGNWRKLIKGMIIREKLRIKYKIGMKKD